MPPGRNWQPRDSIIPGINWWTVNHVMMQKSPQILKKRSSLKSRTASHVMVIKVWVGMHLPMQGRHAPHATATMDPRLNRKAIYGRFARQNHRNFSSRYSTHKQYFMEYAGRISIMRYRFWTLHLRRILESGMIVSYRWKPHLTDWLSKPILFQKTRVNQNTL